MNQFVRYWQEDLEMQQQRAAWLIGYFKEDSHYELGIRAVVEGLYEPPQVGIVLLHLYYVYIHMQIIFLRVLSGVQWQ